jgi:hypothetical protein
VDRALQCYAAWPACTMSRSRVLQSATPGATFADSRDTNLSANNLTTDICHHLIATFLPLANLRKSQMTSALQSHVFLTFATPPVIRAINHLCNPGPGKGNALYEVKR